MSKLTRDEALLACAIAELAPQRIGSGLTSGDVWRQSYQRAADCLRSAPPEIRAALVGEQPEIDWQSRALAAEAKLGRFPEKRP